MAEGRHPGLPRVRLPDQPERQGERRGYKVVKLQFAADASNIRQQEITGEGTHLYLAELAGSDSVSVKLDVPGAGWIEMEEGDIVSREFLKFWARSNSRFMFDNGKVAFGAPCEATFYISIGPMIVRAPKKYGLRSGFFTVSGVATTTGVDAWGQFATQYTAALWGATVKGKPAYLKYGGTLYVRNQSTTDSLWMYQGIPGSFSSGSGVYPSELTAIEVPPGVTQPFLIENRLANLAHPDPAGRAVTLVIAKSTAAGTVNFQVLASRMIFDFSDAESIGGGVPGLET